MSIRTYIIGLVCVWCCNAYGQVDTTYCSITNYGFRGFPLAFYLPETGLSAGGAGIFTFRVKQDTSLCPRPSSLQIGTAYTSRGQFLLFVPFELYLQNGKYRVLGELGYYRYQYNYHGVGATSRATDLETYDVNFPRVRAELLRSIDRKWLFGLGYAYDQFNITEVVDDGILAEQSPVGIEGGAISGVLFKFLYDSRDHLFEPHHGAYVELSATVADGAVGSSYDFVRYRFDARKYIHIGNWVLAGQLNSGYSTSGAPFFQYPYVGSGKRGRGLADRRFIARHVTTAQVESRIPIKGRLGGVVFASTSWVADDLLQVDDSQVIPAAGVGLRYVLDKTELTRLRLDYGLSRDGGQFYLTINEAF